MKLIERIEKLCEDKNVFKLNESNSSTLIIEYKNISGMDKISIKDKLEEFGKELSKEYDINFKVVKK